MEDEEWKEIDDFPKYEVSSYGNVRKKGGKILTLRKERYIRVALYKDSKKPTHLLVHRLVAQAFHRKPSEKEVIDHIDRDKHNNHKNNLRWCSQRENLWNKEHKGCHKKKDRNKWESSIRDNTGKKVWLGSFDTEEEAMEAYHLKAIELRRK